MKLCACQHFNYAKQVMYVHELGIRQTNMHELLASYASYQIQSAMVSLNSVSHPKEL